MKEQKGRDEHSSNPNLRLLLLPSTRPPLPPTTSLSVSGFLSRSASKSVQFEPSFYSNLPVLSHFTPFAFILYLFIQLFVYLLIHE